MHMQKNLERVQSNFSFECNQKFGKRKCSPEPIGTIGGEARTTQRGQDSRAPKGLTAQLTKRQERTDTKPARREAE